MDTNDAKHQATTLLDTSWCSRVSSPDLGAWIQTLDALLSAQRPKSWEHCKSLLALLWLVFHIYIN